jgi:hypothetical protein
MTGKLIAAWFLEQGIPVRDSFAKGKDGYRTSRFSAFVELELS